MDSIEADHGVNGKRARNEDHENQSDDEQGAGTTSDQSEGGDAGGLFGSGSEAEDDRFLLIPTQIFTRLTHIPAAIQGARSAVSSMTRDQALEMIRTDLIG